MFAGIVKSTLSPRRRMWSETDAYIRRAAVSWTGVASETLVHEGEIAADAYAGNGEHRALEAVDDSAWIVYVSRLWVSVVPDAADMAQAWIDGKANLLISPAQSWVGARWHKASNDPFVQAAVRWVRSNGAREAQEITKSSRRIIAEQIRIGIEKGEDTEQIAARISKHYKSVNKSRAKTIARTEVHAATNYGTLAAALDAGDSRMRKIWTTMHDARVREAHDDIDGQSRPLDEAFDMGGEKLMFPGDTSYGAPGEYVIGCRCNLWLERQRRRRPRAA